MRRTLKNLTELEQAVMASVWKRRQATADQVRTDIAPQHDLKESTVRTLLGRLETKGYLQHTVDGRTYVYTSVEEPRNLAVRAVRQIIDRFCSGSVEQLMAGMVDEEVVDARQLRKLLAQIEKGKK